MPLATTDAVRLGEGESEPAVLCTPALHYIMMRRGREMRKERAYLYALLLICRGSPYHDYQSSAISHRFKLERVKQAVEEIKDLSWRQK